RYPRPRCKRRDWCWPPGKAPRKTYSSLHRPFELDHGLLIFLLARRAIMPDRHVFHIAHAFTLDGLGTEHEWSLARASGDRAENGSRVMPVNLGRLPSERGELLREGIKRRMCNRGPPETLKVVVIDRGDNVRAAERGSHHHRFPGRAFLHLAVAEHHVDDPIGLAPAFGQRHSDRHGKTVTKRTRRSLDARVAVIRMAAEPAVGLAIMVQIPSAQQTGFIQNSV